VPVGARELEPPPLQYHYEAPCLIYNGVLAAKPPRVPGAEPLVRVQGNETPPEVESFLAFKCPTKAAKFAVLTVSV